MSWLSRVSSGIPFLPKRDGEGRIRLLGHFARANPQFEALQKARHVLAIFQGPHAYVSPTWYAEPSHAVPTWNYAVVHAFGTLEIIEDPVETRRVLEATGVAFDWDAD